LRNFLEPRLRVASPETGLAAYVGAPPGDLVLATNATSALTTAIRSLSLGPGDEVLLGDAEYGGLEILWNYIAARTGALFTSLTVTLKLLLSLICGTPLSVTFTVTDGVVPPSDSPGVQVNRPVLALSVAPAGPVTKLYVSTCAGMSGSLADKLTFSVTPSLTL